MLGSGNVRTHITEPAGFDSFAFAGVGPGHGDAHRRRGDLEEEKDVDTTGDPTLPKVPLPLIPKQHAFSDIVAVNGGERQPSHQEAPQFIRQMWVYVTKPLAVMQATAAIAPRDPPRRDRRDAGRTAAHADAAPDRHPRARRDYARHFHTLTTYRGRVYNTFDGNVDDNGYWEFGGARDDAQLFTATGGLTMQLNGPETGAQQRRQAAARAACAGYARGGGQGRVQPAGGPCHPINGDQTGPIPTNVLSLRMRVPNDPTLLATCGATRPRVATSPR